MAFTINSLDFVTDCFITYYVDFINTYAFGRFELLSKIASMYVVVIYNNSQYNNNSRLASNLVSWICSKKIFPI